LPGTSNWDALVIDLDALESNSVDMKELVDIAASHTRHMIVLVPPRLQELEAELAGRGLFMLRKPTSSGEIALGLRMLFKDTLSGSSLGPTGDNKKKRDR
jgi:hypothetical protein